MDRIVSSDRGDRSAGEPAVYRPSILKVLESWQGEVGQRGPLERMAPCLEVPIHQLTRGGTGAYVGE